VTHLRLTAIPLGLACFLRSLRGEKLFGLAVVALVIVRITWESWQAIFSTDPGEMLDNTHRAIA
jgi:hypothetical protein